jgi:hypothetical protein
MRRARVKCLAIDCDFQRALGSGVSASRGQTSLGRVHFARIRRRGSIFILDKSALPRQHVSATSSWQGGLWRCEILAKSDGLRRGCALKRPAKCFAPETIASGPLLNPFGTAKGGAPRHSALAARCGWRPKIRHRARVRGSSPTGARPAPIRQCRPVARLCRGLCGQHVRCRRSRN